MGNFIEENTPTEKQQATPAQEGFAVKPSPDALLDFKPIAQIKKRNSLKMLVTGRAGVGKTRFVLTAKEPVYLIDTEMGVSPFATFAKEKNISTKEVYHDDEDGKFDPMASLDDIERTINLLRTKIPNGTLGIDSLTSLWQWLQDWLRYEVVHAGGKINRKGVPADRRDWAKATTRHNQIIMALLSMNCNVVLTAQNHPTYDDKGNVLNVDKTSTQKNAPFLMDIILELESKFTGGTTKYYGTIKKCRFPGLSIEGKVIEDPTFDKIYNLIFGGGKKNE